jgi:uncharacterized membrane protein YphA (DoxX/SURF4 family)
MTTHREGTQEGLVCRRAVLVGSAAGIVIGAARVAHEARTDWSMLLGALFLLLVGAGAGSLDARLSRAAPDGSTWERRHG